MTSRSTSPGWGWRFVAAALALLPAGSASAGACDACCQDMGESDDPSACLNRQAKTGCGEGASTPGCSNGCGPDGWMGDVVKAVSRASQADFTPGCDAHDNCYNTCRGSDRSSCDAALHNSMTKACDASLSDPSLVLARFWCQVVADSEYIVVMSSGQVAYDADQRLYCSCCDKCASTKPVDFASDPANCGKCGETCSGFLNVCRNYKCDCEVPCGDGKCCNPGGKEVCCTLVSGAKVCESATPPGNCTAACTFECADHNTCCAKSAFKGCCEKANFTWECVLDLAPDGKCP